MYSAIEGQTLSKKLKMSKNHRLEHYMNCFKASLKPELRGRKPAMSAFQFPKGVLLVFDINSDSILEKDRVINTNTLQNAFTKANILLETPASDLQSFDLSKTFISMKEDRVVVFKPNNEISLSPNQAQQDVNALLYEQPHKRLNGYHWK